MLLVSFLLTLFHEVVELELNIVACVIIHTYINSECFRIILVNMKLNMITHVTFLRTASRVRDL